MERKWIVGGAGAGMVSLPGCDGTTGYVGTVAAWDGMASLAGAGELRVVILDGTGLAWLVGWCGKGRARVVGLGREGLSWLVVAVWQDVARVGQSECEGRAGVGQSSWHDQGRHGQSSGRSRVGLAREVEWRRVGSDGLWE